MNYGKSKLPQTRKNLASDKPMRKKRVGVRLFKAIILCLLLVCIIGAAGVGYLVKQILDDTPEVSVEDIMPQGYTTTILDEDGNILVQLSDSDSNREYKSYDEISSYMGYAFVAIEDERFFEHNGIDIQGIIRAGFVGIANGFSFTEGASTITQQLIKNNVFPDFINETTMETVERKIQEWYLALQIEQELSKEEILEAYMNTINLGQGCYGVQTAAERYFNKDADELTLSECAVLAAITQNPSNLNPVSDPEANATRRQKVLDNMLELGFITQDEYDEAVADDVYSRILENDASTDESTTYTYFVDAVITQVVDDLMEVKGYTETQAYNLLYSGGLTITTTQDSEIQAICDEEVENITDSISVTEYSLDYALTVYWADGSVENYSKEMLSTYISETTDDDYPLIFSSEEAAEEAIEEYKDYLGVDEDAGDVVDESIEITEQPQTSVVIMDQYTGEVKALVGGRGEKTGSLSLNRATSSARQPGSCFKILAAYAPALNEGNITLATTIVDEKYEYSNGQSVSNWDSKYIGSTTVRYAITHSMNVIAVKTLTEYVGTTLSYDYLLEFGFTTLTDEDMYSQAKALGGITNGVYNIEMTAAYAAIANGGTYIEPTLYTQILDHDGNVLIDNEPETHEVISQAAAYLITSAMQDVVTATGGTGSAAALDDMPVAAKTGTTQESRDLWISAFTPYYTSCVWGGYDESKTMSGQNTNWPKLLWKNIMESIQDAKGLEYTEFEMPSTVEEVSVCKKTGLIATSSCSKTTEYYDVENMPTEYCSGHYTKKTVEEDEEEEEDTEETEDTGGETDDADDAAADEADDAAADEADDAAAEEADDDTAGDDADGTDDSE